MFDGESCNPQKVAEYIKNEISRLKKEGISDSVFEAAKRSVYGTIVKRYNSVEDIVMAFIDSAVCGFNVFDELDIIKNLSKQDIEKYLKIFDDNKSVLSVILPN